MAKTEDVYFTGTKSGLLVRLSPEGEFNSLREKLEEKLGAAERFFNGSAITIDVGQRSLTTAQLLELEAIFNRRFGVRVLQVIDSQSQPQQVSETAPVPMSITPVKGGSATERKRSLLREIKAASPPGTANGQGQHWQWPSFARPGESLIVRRTLRSGQHVRHPGSVVVLGDVHPGAEVVAGGDILVMGTLRGLAHAGANGNTDVVVAAFRLRPTQLRIGSLISRAPDGDEIAPNAPEVALVRNGAIVIEAYLPVFLDDTAAGEVSRRG